SPSASQPIVALVPDQRRPAGVLPATPYSLDLDPYAALVNPSAASPRLSNSRTADARLGKAKYRGQRARRGVRGRIDPGAAGKTHYRDREAGREKARSPGRDRVGSSGEIASGLG